MNFDKFTIKSQEADQQALTIATMNGQQAIENGHILKAILDADQNVTPFILKKIGKGQTILWRLITSCMRR